MSFLLLVNSVSVMAQRPAYNKMSALVREACVVSQNNSTALAKRHAPYKVPSLTAFVKTTNPVSDLSKNGCRVLAQYGNLYIVSLPIRDISQLSLRPDVMRIEAGRGNELTMDTTKIIVDANAVNEGLNLPQSYTGKGVVVGIQDIGFDLTHPTFFSKDMRRYRIKAMWDQLSNDTIGSRLPVGRDYRDSVSLLTVGHPLDGLTQTHGTHTAGIAAGSGSEGKAGTNVSPYSGIAPDADLCLVCNATSDDAALIPEEDQYKYTYAIDALGFKYIFDYADSVGKPCVINFSEGSRQDFRGDDVLYYEMLDSLIGPGHILVASAGNEGININYVHKKQSEAMVQTDVTGRWHSRTMSFTTRSTSDFTLDISYNGVSKDFSLNNIVASADSTLKDSIVIGGNVYRITAMAYPDCYSDEHKGTDWIITSDNYIYPRKFTLQLRGDDADVELYPVSSSFSNTTSGDNTHSILSPGSAPNVICVGMNSYRKSFTNERDSVIVFGSSRNGGIDVYSSIGPTFDGRTKPDVVAPGINIISSYNSFYMANNPSSYNKDRVVRSFNYNGRIYTWNVDSGTSMSTPVVTGVIALWLQANPHLTPQDCKDIFAKTCSHYDESLTYPNNTYGYGQIDAYKGLQLILEKTTGIKTVAFGDKKDKRIYTIDGRYVGTNLNSLPHGIYIINKRKVAIK